MAAVTPLRKVRTSWTLWRPATRWGEKCRPGESGIVMVFAVGQGGWGRTARRRVTHTVSGWECAEMPC